MTFYVQVHPTQPNHHRIEHNYFGDRRRGTGNRWETIRLGHSEQQSFVSATTVARNLFYRCNGENECVSNKSTGNRFLHNAFIETRGELTLRHGDRAWIEGNYFFGGDDPASRGVRAIGSNHVVINNYFKRVPAALVIYTGEAAPEPRGYAPVVNALVAFNTFEECVAPTLVLGATNRPVRPKNVRLAYNLVQADSGPIVEMPDGKVDVSHAGNLMFGAELGIGTTAGIDRTKPSMKVDARGRIFPDATQLPVRVDLRHVPEVEHDLNGLPRGGDVNVGAIGVESARPLYPLYRYEAGPVWMRRS